MKSTVTEFDFINSFTGSYENNFSYEGKIALFEYLEQLEEDCDIEIELDPIAFCCEYSEMTIKEALDYYDLETLEDLEDRTMVIYIDDLENYREYDAELDGDKRIIYQAF